MLYCTINISDDFILGQFFVRNSNRPSYSQVIYVALPCTGPGSLKGFIYLFFLFLTCIFCFVLFIYLKQEPVDPG